MRGGGGGGGEDLNLCAWARGVVPISSFTMDVANWGPVCDWAFQLPHYLGGWALIVDQNYDRAFNILESYYSGVSGLCLNATTVWRRESLGWFFLPWGYAAPPEGVGMSGGRTGCGIGGCALRQRREAWGKREAAAFLGT